MTLYIHAIRETTESRVWITKRLKQSIPLGKYLAYGRAIALAELGPSWELDCIRETKPEGMTI